MIITTLSPPITICYISDAPVITLNPGDQSAEDGAIAVFTASATGYDTVQWYEQGIEIPGETATTLSVIADYVASGNNNYNYSAKFSNVDGSTTTSLAKLTVTTVIPIIVLQPEDLIRVVGDTEALILPAEAINFDTVQWFKKNRLTGNFIAIPGQTTSTYTEIASYTGYFEEYYAEFTNTYQTVRTRTSTVYVDSEPLLLTASFDVGFSVGFN